MTPIDRPSPSRLAFCITDLDVGGAERALVELVTRLDRSRWEPAVVCLGPEGPLVDVLESAAIPVTCLGARSVLDVRLPWRLKSVLVRLEPELLQTFLFHANVVGRIAGRWAGVPQIVSGIRVADRRGRWRHWVDGWTAGRADHHVCVSEAVARFTTQHSGIPVSEITVIPNGVDIERFANADPADLSDFGIPGDARVLLFVGRLDPQKDPLGLLDAFDDVASYDTDAHFLLVGDGPLRGEIEQRRGASPYADRVHLAGRRDDVPRLMRAATLLVLPSRFEGMPNVVLEAMAAGVPVVSTAVEGVTELLVDGRTGLVVPIGDRGALGTAMGRLLSDTRLATRLAAAAQAHVREHFTHARVVAAYVELYERLLNDHASPDS